MPTDRIACSFPRCRTVPCRGAVSGLLAMFLFPPNMQNHKPIVSSISREDRQPKLSPFFCFQQATEHRLSLLLWSSAFSYEWYPPLAKAVKNPLNSGLWSFPAFAVERAYRIQAQRTCCLQMSCFKVKEGNNLLDIIVRRTGCFNLMLA